MDHRVTHDIRSPCAPGSLMRAAHLTAPGRFRLARRDAELYSVQITSAGAAGRIVVETGDGREVFRQPSTFTGSFWLSGYCEGGIVVILHAPDEYTAPHVTINWREQTREMA